MNVDFVTKPVAAAMQRTMSNKHTSIAACVYVGSIVLARLGKVVDNAANKAEDESK